MANTINWNEWEECDLKEWSHADESLRIKIDCHGTSEGIFYKKKQIFPIIETIKGTKFELEKNGDLWLIQNYYDEKDVIVLDSIEEFDKVEELIKKAKEMYK